MLDNISAFKEKRNVMRDFLCEFWSHNDDRHMLCILVIEDWKTGESSHIKYAIKDGVSYKSNWEQIHYRIYIKIQFIQFPHRFNKSCKRNKKCKSGINGRMNWYQYERDELKWLSKLNSWIQKLPDNVSFRKVKSTGKSIYDEEYHVTPSR